MQTPQHTCPRCEGTGNIRGGQWQDEETCSVCKGEGSVVLPRPIWITVDVDTFEGHQGHWADCFYSNAVQAIIEQHGTGMCLRSEETITAREMTDEELAKYPEVVQVQLSLLSRYGEI